MGSTKRKQGNMRKNTRGKEGRAYGMEGGKKERKKENERREAKDIITQAICRYRQEDRN
jgi:hypothetical protein